MVTQRLIGLPIECAKKGHGSFLTFDLGQRLKSEEERREWHVWIYCCYWELFVGDSSLSHCEDEVISIEKAVKRLEGRSIEAIAVEESGNCIFRFSGGEALEIYPWEEDTESWMIYTPEGLVLSFNSTGTWDFVRGDCSVGEVLKQSIPQVRKKRS